MRAVGIVGIGQGPGVMQLENVHVVGSQIPQAVRQVAHGGGFVRTPALGGDDDATAYPGKSLANLGLAVGIRMGGIEEIDPVFVSLAQ